jgi:2-amino-4-hydroxy-6-hydroxymethyldihydropteridine diphosphokinase
MAKVIVALGSNLKDRLGYLRQAADFLEELSDEATLRSSIYESEPVGPSEFDFLNAVIEIHTELSPQDLLQEFKDFEHNHDRPTRYPKWTPRTIDLDIISYDDVNINQDKLQIPHPEYHKRRFVLEPLQEIRPDWKDPIKGTEINSLIKQAPSMNLNRTSLSW